MENVSPIAKYVLITPWCTADKLECYNALVLLAHVSGMPNSAVSFFGFSYQFE